MPFQTPISKEREFQEKCQGICLDGQSAFCCPKPPRGCYNNPLPNIPRQQVIHCVPKHKAKPEPGHFEGPKDKIFMAHKYPCRYCPGKCERPCCRHVPEPTCCKYDDPCKAQCLNHPPGMKPSGRYPPLIYSGPLGRTC